MYSYGGAETKDDYISGEDGIRALILWHTAAWIKRAVSLSVPLICSLALPAGVVGCATTTAPRTTSLLRSYRRTLAPRFHLASYLDH